MKILAGEEATTLEPWTFPEVKTSRAIEKDARQKQEEQFLDQHHAQQAQANLQVDVQAAIDQGYQDGFVQGQQQGLAEVKSVHEPLWQQKIAALEQIVQRLATPLMTVDAELEKLLCELVMKLTRHILRHEVSTRPEQIVFLVKDALALLPLANQSLRIYVNPQDKEMLSGALSSEYAQCLTEDVHMQRGECRVSSDTSELDATFETRLAHLFAQVFHEGN